MGWNKTALRKQKKWGLKPLSSWGALGVEDTQLPTTVSPDEWLLLPSAATRLIPTAAYVWASWQVFSKKCIIIFYFLLKLLCRHGYQVPICCLPLFSTTGRPSAAVSNWLLWQNCCKIPGKNFASADQRAAAGQAWITLDDGKKRSAFTAILGSCLCQEANFKSWKDTEKTLSHISLLELGNIIAKINISQQIHYSCRQGLQQQACLIPEQSPLPEYVLMPKPWSATANRDVWLTWLSPCPVIGCQVLQMTDGATSKHILTVSTRLLLRLWTNWSPGRAQGKSSSAPGMCGVQPDFVLTISMKHCP